MKIRWIVLAALVLCMAGCDKSNPTPKAAAQPIAAAPHASNSTANAVIVHVTDKGKKYHSAGCRYLSKSDHEISLGDALAAGYTPCSKCGPPIGATP